jgi:hypothetical protein
VNGCPSSPSPAAVIPRHALSNLRAQSEAHSALYVLSVSTSESFRSSSEMLKICAYLRAVRTISSRVVSEFGMSTPSATITGASDTKRGTPFVRDDMFSRRAYASTTELARVA